MEQQRFLDFLEIQPRAPKPRPNGQTAICEWGEPISWTREMLEAYGEFVDSVKIAINSLVMPWKHIERKVQLYRDHQIEVAMDDPTFSIAYYEGKVEHFFRTLKDLGFTHVQVETRTHLHDLPGQDPAKADEDELRFYTLARELGLKVEGEVGQKYEEGDIARAAGGKLNVPTIVAEMKRLLELGCEHVYLESAVIRMAIGDLGEKQDGTEDIKHIVEAVGLDRAALEINGALMPFDTAQAHRFWAVRTFGPQVNMGGAELLADMPFIEAIRRGILFAKGPSRSTSRLWVKSLARGNGKAATDWWREPYPIDAPLVRR